MDDTPPYQCHSAIGFRRLIVGVIRFVALLAARRFSREGGT
jgi:hypothetical protein